MVRAEIRPQGVVSAAQTGAEAARTRTGIGALVRATWRQWNDDSGILLAAGLAFFGALAASPLIVIATAASRTVAKKPLPASEVFDPIAIVVGPRAAGTVAQTVSHSPAASGGPIPLQVVGITIALLAGAGLFVQFRTILDVTFGFERPKDAKGKVGDLLSGIVATGCVAAVAVGHGFALRAAGAARASSRGGAVAAVQITTILILAALVPVAYRYLAREKVEWVPALWGSAVALLVAAVASLIMRQYFASGWAGKVYGPAASMFVALLWLLMLAIGTVVGAEIAHLLQRGRTGVTNG